MREELGIHPGPDCTNRPRRSGGVKVLFGGLYLEKEL